MELRAGTRVGSAVCATEIIVVRPADGDVTLTCGGQPMVALGDARGASIDSSPAVQSSARVGKRYHDAESGLEVLVTKAGAGPLAANGRELLLKEAKKLPSSD